MLKDFICPHCEGHMLVAGHIIFAAVKKKDNETGIILLDSRIGDYTSILHPDFKVEDGDEVDFLCPMCHKSLAAKDVHERLVRIIFVDERGEKYEIYFSGVAGEHCTYKITGSKIESVGESSEKYLKYFKLYNKYRGFL